MRFNVGVASDDEVSKVELDSEAEKFAATIGPMKNLSIKRENQSLKFLMTKIAWLNGEPLPSRGRQTNQAGAYPKSFPRV